MNIHSDKLSATNKTLSRLFTRFVQYISLAELNQPANIQPSSKFLLISASLVVVILSLILTYMIVGPRWSSNDDVGMSMAAHGYGIAVIGTPTIIYSNVLWGYLVRTIPEVDGVLGYSIASISVLVIVGAVVLYGLRQLGANATVYLSLFALILVRPVLFLDFTVNSGLLLIAAIICWNLYARQNDVLMLIVGSFLAFFSYLIRSEEFLLVFIVALPLLPWRTLLLSRFSKVVF